MVYYCVFGVFHPCEALFSGFFQYFQGYLVDSQKNSIYRDVAPLSAYESNFFGHNFTVQYGPCN